MDSIIEIHELMDRFFIMENDENAFPQQILEISKEEYDEIKVLNSEIYQFRYFQRKILEVQLNFNDYFNAIDTYEKNLFELSNEKEKHDYLDLIYVDINRIFINFISSFKSFLEHFESRLKKKYGNKSPLLVKEFKKFRANNYDNMFAHKLFINLRNYAQHEDFPIFHIDYVLDYKEGVPFKGMLIASFDKNKLLESRDIKRTIGNDLKHMNDKFPVHLQMVEITNFISGLLDKIIELDFHKLKNAAEKIISCFLMSYKRRSVEIGFLEKSERGYSWQQTLLEVSTSQFLLEKINKTEIN